MMSYPLEKDKGKAFAIFWAIFQFGSFLGSIIALAINIKSGSLTAVSTSTYVVRPVLIVFTLPLFLAAELHYLRWLSFLIVGFHRDHLHWYRICIYCPPSEPRYPFRRDHRQTPSRLQTTRRGDRYGTSLQGLENARYVLTSLSPPSLKALAVLIDLI